MRLIHRTSLTTLTGAVCLALLLAACGGSNKVNPPVAGSELIGSDAIDGSINNNMVVDINDDAVAGDTIGNAEIRGFLSFDISTIPPGAQILEAVLTVHQNTVTGNPYGIFGDCEVDHVTLNGVLDASDFLGGSLSLNIGPISTNATLEPKTLIVTSQVALDITQGRSTTDFRFHFAGIPTNADGNEDSARFGTSLGPNVPTLEITYLTFP